MQKVENVESAYYFHDMTYMFKLQNTSLVLFILKSVEKTPIDDDGNNTGL